MEDEWGKFDFLKFAHLLEALHEWQTDRPPAPPFTHHFAPPQLGPSPNCRAAEKRRTARKMALKKCRGSSREWCGGDFKWCLGFNYFNSLKSLRPCFVNSRSCVLQKSCSCLTGFLGNVCVTQGPPLSLSTVSFSHGAYHRLCRQHPNRRMANAAFGLADNIHARSSLSNLLQAAR